MPTPEQPKLGIDAPQGSISLDASDWLRQFIKHFEDSFVEASARLTPDSDLPTYQLASVRAVVQTLIDSGMTLQGVLEIFGQVAIDRSVDSVEWTSDLNKRRFALIDKEIQGDLLPTEQIELAGLTKIMRQSVESELNVPIEGAKALHRRLIELRTRD